MKNIFPLIAAVVALAGCMPVSSNIPAPQPAVIPVGEGFITAVPAHVVHPDFR